MCPPGFSCNKYVDHMIFFKLEVDEKSVPCINETIRVDDSLHVQLFTLTSSKMVSKCWLYIVKQKYAVKFIGIHQKWKWKRFLNNYKYLNAQFILLV